MLRNKWLFLVLLPLGFIIAAQQILKPLPGKVNQPFKHAAAPSVTADGKTIFYLMQNPNEDGAKERDDWDIFTASLANQEWGAVKPLRILNTKAYEGFPSVSADGKTIFFSSDAYSELKDKDIYFSRLEKGRWSPPQSLGEAINVKGLDEIGGSISPNENYFVFFARDRDDGLGGTDIYISEKDSNGKWLAAKNLRNINSKDNEYAPYLAADGRTLYFSSDRPGSLGGQDIYKSILTKGVWQKPVNIGPKINTKGNDIGISIPASGDIFYTSTNSQGGNYIILSGELPLEARPFKVVLVKAEVKDKYTGKFLKARVMIDDMDSGKNLGSYAVSDEDGSMVLNLTEGTSYGISIVSDGYFILDENFNLVKTGDYREENLTFSLAPIKKGEVVQIKNIFFESGASRLSPKSKLSLSQILEMLKKYKNLKLEIQGHTDDVGQSAANLKLSEERARNVYQYLLDMGAAPNQLAHKGYGDSRPKAKNISDKNRALNRRIDFLILEN